MFEGVGTGVGVGVDVDVGVGARAGRGRGAWGVGRGAWGVGREAWGVGEGATRAQPPMKPFMGKYPSVRGSPSGATCAGVSAGFGTSPLALLEF